jgi:hypothetical protein
LLTLRLAALLALGVGLLACGDVSDETDHPPPTSVVNPGLSAPAQRTNP